MKKILIILAGALILLTIVLWAKRKSMAEYLSPESRAKTNLIMAVQYLQAGKTDDALRKITAALSLNPNYAEAHYYLAKAYMQQRQPLEAEIGEYKKTIELDPTFMRARHDLAAVYFEQGNYDGAFREVQEVLEIDPKNAVGHNNMGRIHMAKKDQKKAEEHFRRAIEIDPQLDIALNNLGSLYFLQGKWEESKVEFMESLSIAPKNPIVHYFLAQIAEKQKDEAKAIEYWEKAISLGLKGDPLKEAQGRLEVLKK
jgi:Tfp pilus assembly protein PilF